MANKSKELVRRVENVIAKIDTFAIGDVVGLLKECRDQMEATPTINVRGQVLDVETAWAMTSEFSSLVRNIACKFVESIEPRAATMRLHSWRSIGEEIEAEVLYAIAEKDWRDGETFTDIEEDYGQSGETYAIVTTRVRLKPEWMWMPETEWLPLAEIKRLQSELFEVTYRLSKSELRISNALASYHKVRADVAAERARADELISLLRERNVEPRVYGGTPSSGDSN